MKSYIGRRSIRLTIFQVSQLAFWLSATLLLLRRAHHQSLSSLPQKKFVPLHHRTQHQSARSEGISLYFSQNFAAAWLSTMIFHFFLFDFSLIFLCHTNNRSPEERSGSPLDPLATRQSILGRPHRNTSKREPRFNISHFHGIF